MLIFFFNIWNLNSFKHLGLNDYFQMKATFNPPLLASDPPRNPDPQRSVSWLRVYETRSPLNFFLKANRLESRWSTLADWLSVWNWLGKANSVNELGANFPNCALQFLKEPFWGLSGWEATGTALWGIVGDLALWSRSWGDGRGTVEKVCKLGFKWEETGWKNSSDLVQRYW